MSMTLDEARKLSTLPSKLAYMVINLAYNHSIVLSQKDGIALLAALGQAEQMDPSYGGNKHIIPLQTNKLVVSYLSHHDYLQRRMAALLGISLYDLEKSEEEAKEKDKEPTL